jgi:hypothetical protein
MIGLYDHRAASVRASQVQSQSRSATAPFPEELRDDPSALAQPRYWVPRTELLRRLPDPPPWHVAFRDIANPNNERTLIAAAIPGDVACGNTLPVLCTPGISGPRRACLLANLASLALDYAIRSKAASRHANWYVMKQLPVLPPQRFDDPAIREYIASRVLTLSYTAYDMEPMASDVGGQPDVILASFDAHARLQARCELDALFLLMYGLDRAAIDHILGTFDVLRRRELRAFGEYRTHRLILESLESAAARLG